MVVLTRIFRARTLLPVAGLFALLLLSLFLVSGMVRNSALFDQYRQWLLAFNTLLLLIFIVLIAINVVSLVRAYLARRAGSRLTMRLALLFVSLMLVPALTVYVFSIWLLGRGMDNWFDADVEAALENSLELSRWSLDTQLRHLRGQVETMAGELSNTPDELLAYTLESLLEESKASEMALLHGNREMVASVGKDVSNPLPALPPENVLREVAQGEPYIGMDLIGDGGFYARLVFPIASGDALGESRLLQVLYPMPDRVNRLAGGVEQAYSQYNRLLFLREPLTQNFTLALTLVLLFGTLYAVWVAFYSSRKLATPITMLAEGTQAVAAGRLDTRLDVPVRDELGMLVESFNEMTRKLSKARAAAEHGREQLEKQHTYLETVLEHVSSGVLSLDENLNLKTANTAASEILSVALDRRMNHPLCGTYGAGPEPTIDGFCRHVLSAIEDGEAEWSQQLELTANETHKILFCRGAHLPSGGHVIVISDISDVVQAQRDRAWREVAQRMAHEFKNPLTPIQLSAERLESKLANKLGADEAALLERSARTIIQQVEAMKNIVNDFSVFARGAPAKLKPVALNHLVGDVIELYRSDTGAVQIEFQPTPGDPRVLGDEGRLRQLLHNLLINACDALHDHPAPHILVATHGEDPDFIVFTVRDNGPGFGANILENMYEPYVTTKPSGTGLGLAIVRKIVEEHGGSIHAVNPKDCGAAVYVSLRRADNQ